MTVIVLLILAGVSLNAIVGDNGIFTQATKAKKVAEEADRREKIEMMVMGYVSKIENAKESLPTYLKSRIGKEIDEAIQLPDPNHMGERVNAVIKDEHYYMILENENGDYIVEEMNTDLGGDIGDGIALATPDSFSGGTMTFDPR